MFRGVACFAIAAFVLAASAASAAPARDAGAVTGVVVDIATGTVSTEPPDAAAIAAVLDGIPANLRSVADTAATALALAIRDARDQARVGARPIPSRVRAVLARYFPAWVLARARWNVMDSKRLSLEGVMMINRDIAALTLDDVVIFPACRDAVSRWDLWAHELVHVMQYRQMGIDRFAAVYLATLGGDIERQAYAWQDYVADKVRGSGRQAEPDAAPRGDEGAACP